MSGIWKKILSALALVGVWILIWEMAFRLSGKEDWQSIPPMHVLQELWNGIFAGSFLRSLGASLLRVVYGFGFALVLGSLLGLLLATSGVINWLAGPLILGVQSLPSICWIPLAVLWFGLTEKAILFVVLMGSLLSVTIDMEDGRKQMPKIYGMAGRNLGASGFRLFWSVLLPASLPFIVNGMKQGWAFAWRSLIQAEMIFLSLGLGQLLMMGRDLSDMSQVMAVMILIIILGFMVDGLIFRTMERRLQEKYGLTA